MSCVAVLLPAPASTQTTPFGDKNGDPQGRIEQEDSRYTLRDELGNPHGYWQQEGSLLVYRDNAG